MKNLYLRPLLLLLAAAVFSSCASSYHSVQPATAQFTSAMQDPEFEFSYRYDVLRERGNKKYAKKEVKNGVKLVAIKIVNTSENDLIFGQHLNLYSGNSPVAVLDTEIIHKQLKQGVPIYLLYMLLFPMNLTLTTENSQSQTPVGLVLAPGITGLNMAIAGTANSNFKKELVANNLKNRTIKSGETVYGLVGIMDRGYSPLVLK